MAETTGQLSGETAGMPAARSATGASIILVLAFAPQIIELLIALAGLVAPLSGRGPLQVIAAHASALSIAIPSLAQQYAASGKTSLSSDVLLALIYTYPLIAVAVFTFMVRPRAPQDYFGGVVLMAIALFALWASSDLQGMRGFSFGAGTAPRMFGLLLLGLGAAVAVIGVVSEGAQLATYHWRGPLFVSLAILTFAVSIRPLGLLVTGLASFLIAAIGSPETRWREALIVGICLTGGCALLFPYVLGLPMPLLPRFLLQ
ncbi:MULTISPECIES: tripartite tricarboxylate transporter TctB family protein [unclassified Bradyrhizobium]|uniref:tripartite tricarboxylate transporter TctB family protein n=1 Tax=unclassified Bradyrhizobium TaxID=2631580 RepID=UPI0028EAFE48|nr:MULTISPECIES: tripartite tricarboxylate transporter TctB family protein [unclassified Bradyrhizobium]